MRLTDGIEPFDDPILRIRPYVYAESVRRRSGAECPVHLRLRPEGFDRVIPES